MYYSDNIENYVGLEVVVFSSCVHMHTYPASHAGGKPTQTGGICEETRGHEKR